MKTDSETYIPHIHFSTGLINVQVLKVNYILDELTCFHMTKSSFHEFNIVQKLPLPRWKDHKMIAVIIAEANVRPWDVKGW